MKVSKELLAIGVVMTMVACGTASKDQGNKSQDPSSAETKSALAKMDSMAPKYIVAVADKDGKLVKSAAINSLPEGQSVTQIAAGVLADTSTSSSVQVLTGDEANALDGSTQSCHFWHGHHGFWGAPVLPIYMAPTVVVAQPYAPVAPVFAYQTAGMNYYGNYGVYGGAQLPYAGANYNATVYGYNNTYGMAAANGVGGVAGGYDNARNINTVW